VDDNKALFILIKKFLKKGGHNKKRGSSDLHNRYRAIIAELINNKDFITGFNDLWINISSNYQVKYENFENFTFVQQVKKLVGEIIAENSIDIKKQKQAKLDRLFRCEKQIKQHVFKIRGSKN
jgi:hypothetical protein